MPSISQIKTQEDTYDIKDANAITDITINGSSTGVSKTGRAVDLTISSASGGVQKVKVGQSGSPISPDSNGIVTIPDSYPASDTTSIYSSSGTAPVNGQAVASAISNKADASAAITDIDFNDTSSPYLDYYQNGSWVSFCTFSTSVGDNNNHPITSKAVYADQQIQEEEMGVIANLGAKNLLNITTSTNVVNNVDYVHNSDETVSVSTRSSTHAQSSHILMTLGSAWYGRKITLSGCPSGGNYSSGYALYISKVSDSNTIACDPASGSYGQTITLPNEDCQVSILVRANYDISTPILFEPMIRLAEIQDDTFEPYAMTNRELTVNTGIAINAGAKNILKITTSEDTSTYPTFTHAEDGSVFCVGKSNSPQKSHILCTLSQAELYGRKLTLSGCPFGGDYDNKYALYVVDKTNSNNVVAIDTGNGITFTMPGYDCYVAIVLRAGVLNNEGLLFYPMIRDSDIIDNTFVKYAKNNAELTDAIEDINDSIVTSISSSSTDAQIPTASSVYTFVNTNYAQKGTKLSDYGITDAKINNGVITLGSNTITPVQKSNALNNIVTNVEYVTVSGTPRLRATTSNAEGTSTSTDTLFTANTLKSDLGLTGVVPIVCKDYDTINLATASWTNYRGGYLTDVSSQISTLSSDFTKIFSITIYWYSTSGTSPTTAFKSLIPMLGNDNDSSSYPANKIRFFSDVDISVNYSTLKVAVRVVGI